MSHRTPLIIDAGVVQQLQSGDHFGNVTSGNNGSGATVVICTPMYQAGSNDVRRTNATSLAAATVIGLCLSASVSNGAAAIVQTDGTFKATTTQWDAVTGGSGGLTIGSRYYVSATPGELTTTAPSTIGQIVAQVGKAISSTELLIEIGPTIEL
jgi:hypothetical protein